MLKLLCILGRRRPHVRHDPDERVENLVVTIDDEDEFVDRLLARLDAGEWVVDLRARTAKAQLQLVRIGVDHLGGAGIGDLDEVADGLPRRSYPVSDFPGLAPEFLRRPSEVSVVDVRRHDEWSDGHIDGAYNVALLELLTHLHHVPGRKLWVHCASGYRASIAASLLDRAGFSVVLIDADFDAASAAGLDIAVS